MRLLRTAHAAFSVCGIGACLLLLDTTRGWSELQLYPLITAVAVASVLLLILLKPAGLWSATATYAGVFCLFHFGLVGVFGLRLVTGEDLSAYVWDWFFRPETRIAAMVSLIGLLAVVVGSYLPEVVLPPLEKRIAPDEGAGDGQGAVAVGRAASMVGSLLVIASVCAWFWAAWASGGLALLFASYSAYLQALEAYGGLINIIWFTFGFGVVLLMGADPGWWRTLGFAWFGGFCIVGLPLGLRGEVMFPLAAGLVARAASGRALSPLRTSLLVLGGLIAIVAVKQVRQVGLAEVGATDRNVTVFNAFIELGGSLQPVEKVVTWREYGDSFEFGATYWAPIDRSLYYLVPGWTRLPAGDDLRIMNVLVGLRSGPIGFSPVAEGFRNGGVFGVVIAMGVLGVVLGLLERWSAGIAGRLLLAAVLVPILINVRNSFVPIPAQLVLGAGLVALVAFLAVILPARSPNSTEPVRPR